MCIHSCALQFQITSPPPPSCIWDKYIIQFEVGKNTFCNLKTTWLLDEKDVFFLKVSEWLFLISTLPLGSPSLPKSVFFTACENDLWPSWAWDRVSVVVANLFSGRLPFSLRKTCLPSTPCETREKGKAKQYLENASLNFHFCTFVVISYKVKMLKTHIFKEVNDLHRSMFLAFSPRVQFYIYSSCKKIGPPFQKGIHSSTSQVRQGPCLVCNVSSSLIWSTNTNV